VHDGGTAGWLRLCTLGVEAVGGWSRWQYRRRSLTACNTQRVYVGPSQMTKQPCAALAPPDGSRRAPLPTGGLRQQFHVSARGALAALFDRHPQIMARAGDVVGPFVESGARCSGGVRLQAGLGRSTHSGMPSRQHARSCCSVSAATCSEVCLSYAYATLLPKPRRGLRCSRRLPTAAIHCCMWPHSRTHQAMTEPSASDMRSGLNSMERLAGSASTALQTSPSCHCAGAMGRASQAGGRRTLGVPRDV
jgi:hypothetical protein